MRYYAVTLNDAPIGYLWASVSEHAASFINKLDAQGQDEGLRAAVVWSDRLDDAAAKGLSALDALRVWAGRPEHPQAGGIAADAVEREASTLRELEEIANPGHVDPIDYKALYSATSPDGIPFNRSAGWDPLVLNLEDPGYSFITDSPIVYVPVIKGGEVIGYLWAATRDHAADYLPRGRAGAEAYYAHRAWADRLNEAGKKGVPPLETLRDWIGRPEADDAGMIPADASEREAPSVDALQEIARR